MSLEQQAHQQPKVDVQLDLFNAAPPPPALSPEQEEVLERLADVDVSQTTPLDALGLLDELKRKLE